MASAICSIRMANFQQKMDLQNKRRYRIRHPIFGYFQSMERTEFDGAKYYEKFTKEISKAPSFTLADLRRARDANNNGLMALLVAGYTGLSLELVAPTLKVRS